MTAEGSLQRRLGVGDAVVVGAGSMVGAGVFAAWAPAAEAAGTGLLIGLAIAGVVAFCNASSSAQLAAVHPESGGTYVYGRHQLGPAWGHLAGWGFVVGKTASCVAMALTVGAYLWPEQDRWVAVGAVLTIVAVNLGGLSRTVAVTRVLLAVSLAALTAVVVAGWSSDAASLDRLTPIDGDPFEILRAAGFLFFAFAGYARIATLGEEVRDPETTIPKAIPRALGAVLVLYAVVGVTALAVVPVATLAGSDAPLRAVVEAGDLDALGPVVRIGAGIAALGVLLNLIPGVSRTTLAMARRRELPHWFAHIDTGRSLPLRAELTVAAVVVALVLVTDLRSSIALSGVAVLTYYAITNASALRLPAHQRRWPRGIAVVGLVGCVVLAVSLPPVAVAVGGGVLAVGIVVRLVSVRVTSLSE
ncbi:MAG TPA: APC family permease [Acidimicrobiales bacterium]|nr:APC family permease [Acidimicrobiales bacterium]